VALPHGPEALSRRHRAEEGGVPMVHGSGGLGLKSLACLPDNVFIQAHVPADFTLRGFCILTVFRDPRNVLVSYVRHQKRWGGRDLTLAGSARRLLG
jgi:hypothetical protein